MSPPGSLWDVFVTVQKKYQMVFTSAAVCSFKINTRNFQGQQDNDFLWQIVAWMEAHNPLASNQSSFNSRWLWRFLNRNANQFSSAKFTNWDIFFSLKMITFNAITMSYSRYHNFRNTMNLVFGGCRREFHSALRTHGISFSITWARHSFTSLLN